MNESETKISSAYAGLMIAVALLFDLSQFGITVFHLIPAVGNFLAAVGAVLINALAGMTFFLWFQSRGINFVSAKKSLTFLGGFIFEVIPILNALPAWTFVVVRIIIINKAEETAEKTAIGRTVVKVVEMKHAKKGAGKPNPFRNTSRETDRDLSKAA